MIEIGSLQVGDLIKYEGIIFEVKTKAMCFKRNNDTWAFDAQKRGSKGCCVLRFGNSDHVVELIRKTERRGLL